VEIDFDKAGWLSKSPLLKSPPNDDDLNAEKPVLFDEKKSSFSNILCALNRPPPIFAPKPPEKNGSSPNEPNPLLPNPDDDGAFFFYFLFPKKPLKKSSSNGFSSKKCLNTSSAWWKSKLEDLNPENPELPEDFGPSCPYLSYVFLFYLSDRIS